MARIITITFELDDEPWIDDEGETCIHDAPTEALDIVIGAIEGGDIGFKRFIGAKVDGELLVDGDGYASDAAKGSIRYGEFQRLVWGIVGDELFSPMGDSELCGLFGTTLEEVEADVEKYEKDFQESSFAEPIDGRPDAVPETKERA